MYKWFWCCVVSQKGVCVGALSWTDQWFRMFFFGLKIRAKKCIGSTTQLILWNSMKTTG